MSGRLERLRERLPALGTPAMLVSDRTNVRYLTGFESSNAWLFVDAERAFLLTDGRYIEAAGSVDGVEAIHAERNLATDVRGRLGDLTAGPVAFESASVSHATFQTIGESGIELSPSRGVVERLRAVKDKAEIAAIRASAELLSEAFERLRHKPVVGRTEAELAWWVERTIRELGAEAVSFPPILASGPNAALPHHHPGPRAVEENELLLVDAGAIVDGYCSDCTRTFATGPPPPALERAYEACLDAQRRSLDAVRPGAKCVEVDALARGVIREWGYEAMHGLGHSVGLEIHEDPKLSDTSTDAVEAGNALTVEPGIYLPGVGGVRIEDLVVVGEDGIDVLTSVTTELVTIG